MEYTKFKLDWLLKQMESENKELDMLKIETELLARYITERPYIKYEIFEALWYLLNIAADRRAG